MSTKMGHDGTAQNFRPISTNMQSINLIHLHVQEIWTSKNINRKCDADADVHVSVNVNGDDRGDNKSSVHFVQAS